MYQQSLQIIIFYPKISRRLRRPRWLILCISVISVVLSRLLRVHGKNTGSQYSTHPCFLTNKPNFNISLTTFNRLISNGLAKFRGENIKEMLTKQTQFKPNLNTPCHSRAGANPLLESLSSCIPVCVGKILSETKPPIGRFTSPRCYTKSVRLCVNLWQKLLVKVRGNAWHPTTKAGSLPGAGLLYGKTYSLGTTSVVPLSSEICFGYRRGVLVDDGPIISFWKGCVYREK